MRSIIKAFVLLITVITISVIFTKQSSAQQPNVSFQVFYDQLGPYGEWVNYPNYGYVWIPDAGPDFVPYSTQGHWLLTDFGWTWMSDYSWGWAPFHYGRWDYDYHYGWFWVPGNEWGPAWVSWRRADGYYGWAPMESGISLSASFGRAYDSHNDHWIFVKDRDIDRSDINHYYIGRTDQEQIVRRSSVINNTYVDNKRHTTYVTGPARADILKVTGRKVNPIPLQEYNKPGQNLSNGHLLIYRPEVVKNNAKDMKPAPSRITNLSDVKQPSERKITNPKDNRQPATPNTQKNLNNVKTLQSQKSNPPQNVKAAKQPVPAKPAITSTSQNIKKNQQPNNAKTVNATPAKNIKKEPQPNSIKTPNTKSSQNVKSAPQQKNIKPLNTNPSQNTVKGKQTNAIKAPKNNQMEQQNRSNDVKDTKENK